jgi:voltage-gated potassium channel
MRKRIYHIIHRTSAKDKLSMAYHSLMLLAIMVSIIPLMFARNYPLFIHIERITVSLFILDYILRWMTADYQLGKGIWSFVIYPFTGWAIIDLLSILPGLHVASDYFKVLRLSRVMRPLRMFRLFKLLRYTDRFEVLIRVIQKEKKVLFSVLAISIFYVFLTALIMFNVEPHFNPENGEETFGTFFDALYWATVTLTTVGYGDMIPVTNFGRFISMISSLFGIAIIALPSGVITARYMDELRADRKKMELENEQKENDGKEA